MKSLIGLLLALFTSISPATTIDDLKQQANLSDPLAQYDLALHYLNGVDVERSLPQAQYWLEQAAENDNLAARTELINLLRNQTPSTKNTEQTLYWLSLQAISGDQKAPLQLAQLTETRSDQLRPDSLPIIWYHIAARYSPVAEEKYSQLLEARFNQRRLKQVSQADQLSALTGSPALTTTQTEESGAVNPDYLSVVIVVLLSVAVLFILIKRKRQRYLATKQQVNDLEKLHKKLQQGKNSDLPPSGQQQLDNACLMFGCNPGTIPDEKTLKQHYRLLSKIYHPDAGGTSDSMTQLNYAFKLLMTVRKHRTNDENHSKVT